MALEKTAKLFPIVVFTITARAIAGEGNEPDVPKPIPKVIVDALRPQVAAFVGVRK